jgi:hypothetical protein
MPTETAFAVVAIIIPFLAFAAVLFWGDLQTRHLNH